MKKIFLLFTAITAMSLSISCSSEDEFLQDLESETLNAERIAQKTIPASITVNKTFSYANYTINPVTTVSANAVVVITPGVTVKGSLTNTAVDQIVVQTGSLTINGSATQPTTIKNGILLSS